MLTEQDIEQFRNDFIVQLEQENQKRSAKIRELQQAQRGLQAEQRDFIPATLRANAPPPESGICPRCWYADGLRSPIEPVMPNPDWDSSVDYFRCSNRGCHITNTPF